MATCIFCAVELHFECEKPLFENGIFCCCPQEFIGNSTGTDIIVNKRGGPVKESGEDMADVLSTGRKRAAIAAPITEGMICEWAGLKLAGGGVYPLVGCMGNLATDRHHGPDKSVLNNAVGTNLHRICATCHNRWHTRNDIEYGERPPNGEPFIPVGKEMLLHDSETKATGEDIARNELYWVSTKLRKASNE